MIDRLNAIEIKNIVNYQNNLIFQKVSLKTLNYEEHGKMNVRNLFKD